MTSLTIRNVDDLLKVRLRIQAARNGHSMEEEAQLILQAALTRAEPSGIDLGAMIRSRFEGSPGFELPALARDPLRPPPSFEE
jgi:antitoxin FitA